MKPDSHDGVSSRRWAVLVRAAVAAYWRGFEGWDHEPAERQASAIRLAVLHYRAPCFHVSNTPGATDTPVKRM